MAANLWLSGRERRILVVVAGVVVIFLIDLAFRAWGAALSVMEREEKGLRRQRDYAAGLLARSRDIEGRYSAIRVRFPGFFEDDRDPTRLMAELDEIAKTAGVQVTMIRPTQSSEQSRQEAVSRFEMTFRGSWPQVMRFFQTVESREHLFQFSIVSIHRQERTGELTVSAMVQK